MLSSKSKSRMADKTDPNSEEAQVSSLISRRIEAAFLKFKRADKIAFASKLLEEAMRDAPKGEVSPARAAEEAQPYMPSVPIADSGSDDSQ